MNQLKEMRIVLLGKTGDGKSSSGNTILGDSSSNTFQAKSSPSSVTKTCEAHMGRRAGKETSIQIIDTPGFFDTRLSEKELVTEVFRCFTMSVPGPHAFVIVLRLGRFTEQEIETVAKIREYIGNDAFRYTVVLFSNGNDLDDDQTIEQFADQSVELKELVKKCGGRCHVIDNKHWNQQHEYRSNRVQVEKLLDTIEEMVRQNGGGCYSNQMLQLVEKQIQDEQKKIVEEMKESISEAEIREKAKEKVTESLIAKFGKLPLLTVLGAFLGIGLCVAKMLR
ncbi:GTPase IMAP family member 9-like [Sardina pilchardus]|uniref:GTPase IMAP family member 9-like n=1 Tax=Sardina pilchardus TaxID=27697 RepID=UPI002E10C2A9